MTTFYVLCCRDCDEAAEHVLPMPFPTPEARGRWATEHTKATGHQRWFVDDEVRP